jgi:hypothetical protein
MPSCFVMRPTLVTFDALRIHVPVRYEEDDMPNTFPGRTGDVWDVLLDLPENGPAKIRKWPGPAHELYMKVTDAGIYTLLANDEIVTTSSDYVPDFLGDSGDYLVLNIAEDGTITNWPKRPDYTALFPKEE